MTYKVMKNKMNDFQFLQWRGVAPSRYKYPSGSHLAAGVPVLIEARRLTNDDEITVVIYPFRFGYKHGGGQLLKRIPAGDIKQGEWDRIYRKVMESI